MTKDRAVMTNESGDIKRKLDNMLDSAFTEAEKKAQGINASLAAGETGTVIAVGRGISSVKGLFGVKSDELISFPGGIYGIAFNLEPDYVSVVMLSKSESVSAGMEVKRTGKTVSVPAGNSLIGRIIDPLGKPLDDGPDISAEKWYPIERPSPVIMDRAPVSVPLQTGILAIDALIPIGRGQRELILGDRQTGKTAVAVDTIINQRGKNVICVYCSIGQQNSAAAKVIAALKEYGAMDYTFVVAAGGDDSPGMNFIAPYAATSMAEFFTEQGKDVLIVYDDLSKHARSYRELSLLQRRPPAREAFPGDIFYIHSRLLERAAHLTDNKGGGSLTALPVVETEAQNIAAYIPTNLVSITDGQIYLSPKLFQQSVLPAVDVGKSVSRVGGAAQLLAFRKESGDLKLAYSQFEELEIFERFSTKLDAETKKTLARGHRIREVLKQKQSKPVPVTGQIALLAAVNSGLFDGIDESKVSAGADEIRYKVENKLGSIAEKIQSGAQFTDEGRDAVLKEAKSLIAGAQEEKDAPG
ncbi:MAG TPA: F0F1 ATP synthase subunit alpha [Candidatus Goldiibacteriota bacterium]|nr:F0F1 ATP synthase subunit alpha [Candidatus Goldiibacteriota bacterium]